MTRGSMAYIHGAARRSVGSSTVMVQRMNGSPTDAEPPCVCIVAASWLMSGIEMSIANSPTMPLTTALRRTVRYSTSAWSSRASCSCRAV